MNESHPWAESRLSQGYCLFTPGLKVVYRRTDTCSSPGFDNSTLKLACKVELYMLEINLRHL